MDLMQSSLSTGLASQDAHRAKGLEDELTPSSPAKAREAAQAFEAYFIETMLKEMRKSVPRTQTDQGQAMEVYVGLFDQAVSETISKGRGIGLADMIEKSLLRGMELGPEGCHGLGEKDCQFESGIDDLVDLGRISSTYGLRADPITGHLTTHSGLDIAMAEGTPVEPIAPGRVIFSGRKSGYGEIVIIDHGDGLESRYAHLQDRGVEVGDYLDGDHPLGRSGQSGRATGPHLHLEVRQDGQAVDPESFRFPEIGNRP